jgi:iron complex transport system ATP-binding protein
MDSAPDTSIIDIRNATVCRGDSIVFERLNLRVVRGEHAVILGPNGAGKSTLLKLLSREIYPLAADDCVVRLCGQEQGSVWELRAQLGIVSGDLQYQYSPAATGLHVALSGYFASIGVWQHQEYDAAQMSRARDLLAQLGVAHLADRPYGAMSTGEQRRCLLARALVHDPHTLILDEPTSGLDLHATFHYIAVIRALMRAGKTVIFVTHHIHEIPPEIERVILLKQGRIVADGLKGSVLTENNLRALFDVPLHLIERNGFFQVLPEG